MTDDPLRALAAKMGLDPEGPILEVEKRIAAKLKADDKFPEDTKQPSHRYRSMSRQAMNQRRSRSNRNGATIPQNIASLPYLPSAARRRGGRRVTHTSEA